MKDAVVHAHDISCRAHLVKWHALVGFACLPICRASMLTMLSRHEGLVVCCLQDGLPLCIDLLGSCYTDQLRPPALSPHHITRYLHQGIPTAASGIAPHVSPGLSAAALGVEPSMTGISVRAEASELSRAGAGSSTANLSLRMGTSMLSGHALDPAAAYGRCQLSPTQPHRSCADYTYKHMPCC